MKQDRKRYRFAVAVGILLIILASVRLSCELYDIIDSDAERYIMLFAVIASGFVLIGLIVSFYLKLIGNQRQYKALMDVADRMTVFAVLWDTGKKMFYANAAFTCDTGYTSADLADPEKLAKIFPPEALSGRVEDLEKFLEGRDEFTVQCKTGGSVTTSWSTSVMFELENGDQVLMSVGTNRNDEIRLKKALLKTSEALSESDKRYFLATELSGVGLILRYEDRGDYYVSEQLCHMLGLPATGPDKGCFVGIETLREIIRSEDHILLKPFTQGVPGDETISVNVRAKAADGDLHWFNVRYKTIKDGTGYITGGAIIDITLEKEKDLIIEKMAYIDDVTQIYNRYRFIMLGDEMLSSMRFINGSPDTYWVITADIDDFHIINDTCGYETGNDLLKRFAMILMKNITDGSTAARIGGDNFSVLFRSKDEADVTNFFASVRHDLGTISGGGLEKHNIDCSFGYCLMSDSEFVGESFSEILEHSEFALNLTKGMKSSSMRYDAHIRDGVIDRSNMEKEISEALENHEFELYYQPKISLTDGSVIGMEALIRWIKPDGTVIPPLDFIPVAERSMMITRISDFVLHEACRQNKRLQDMGYPPITVSINLTAIDFYKTDVTRIISDVLKETGLDPEYLDIELTESLALKDIQHAIIQMNDLRKLGIKISMDDFGTGYSSLSYIQQLPITLLKLDRSFIMYLEDDEVSREIVSAIIRIAKSKKIETIAEGVEYSAQSEILRDSGCDYAQGYFYGKPMPADKFEQFMEQHTERSMRS
ncbi:MAG: bifunctional diguanylate cyclase/phosphodiesterase [Oscillospiraceae bacterium]|nr:bifunctional diguanylate cyclase/phosphodiesterase [Oscillospiraceae bacterium]